MKGSIQKKSKIYYAVIPLNSKRKWIRGGDTKKDAQRVLNDKLAEINQGTYREVIKATFMDFSETWLKDYAEVKVKPSTFAGYKDIIAKLLNPTFGYFNLVDITTGLLQAHISERLKTVSAKTVCNEIVVIKEMFKHALRWGYLKSNPAEYLERPRLTKPEIEILNPDEVEKLLEISNHYRIAFLTGFQTGMRAGELWGLQWTDIDWNSAQIHVRRSLWKKQFQTPKTKYSIRKIDMTERLIHELKRWKLACPINEDNIVFPSPEGKLSLHDNVVKRYFNQALRKTGLRQVSFHSVRHTNASMRIQAGQNIKYIQTQLGHASINITLDIYGHLFNDVNFNRRQVELFENSFKSVRNPLENRQDKEAHSLQTPYLFGSGGRI
ncbi:MAG: site-specific integrase [Nitrospinae bacterium]|nr:site-specific integrase [Nitrospinota bacterium]